MYVKGHFQGYNVIDLDAIWKGFISWECMPNMKSLSPLVQSYGRVDKKIKQEAIKAPFGLLTNIVLPAISQSSQWPSSSSSISLNSSLCFLMTSIVSWQRFSWDSNTLSCARSKPYKIVLTV